METFNVSCYLHWGHGPPAPSITAGLKQLSPDVLRQVRFDSLAAELHLFGHGPLSSSRYEDQVLASNIFTAAINHIQGIEMWSNASFFFFFPFSFYLSHISVNECDWRLCTPGWRLVCVAVYFQGSQEIYCVSSGRQPFLRTTAFRTPSKITYARDNYNYDSGREIIIIIQLYRLALG